MERRIELVLKITVTVIIEVQFWFSYVSFLLFWAAECLLLRERWELVFCFPWQQDGWQWMRRERGECQWQESMWCPGEALAS